MLNRVSTAALVGLSVVLPPSVSADGPARSPIEIPTALPSPSRLALDGEHIAVLSKGASSLADSVRVTLLTHRGEVVWQEHIAGSFPEHVRVLPSTLEFAAFVPGNKEVSLTVLDLSGGRLLSDKRVLCDRPYAVQVLGANTLLIACLGSGTGARSVIPRSVLMLADLAGERVRTVELARTDGTYGLLRDFRASGTSYIGVLAVENPSQTPKPRVDYLAEVLPPDRLSMKKVAVDLLQVPRGRYAGGPVVQLRSRQFSDSAVYVLMSYELPRKAVGVKVPLVASESECLFGSYEYGTRIVAMHGKYLLLACEQKLYIERVSGCR